MKRIIIAILVLINMSFTNKSDFTDFRDFVSIHYKPSEIVRRNCSWQYAIIKVKTNQANVITHYQIENKVIPELKNAFNFLIGYKIKKSLVNDKHYGVFMVSLENQRTDNCDIPPVNKHQAADSLFKQYKLQHKKEATFTFYINSIITTVIYDPVK